MPQIKALLCGLVIGIANIIPGVSGGTMAVILNIYDKILFAFSVKNIKDNIAFLGALGIGAAAGILLFSRAITFVYENYPMPTNFCFIGLVIGSIPMIYKRAKGPGIEAKNWIPFFLAFLFMVAITILEKMPGEAGNLLAPHMLPTHLLLIWLFIAAFISTIAMILPGISGSFVLLLFGAYTIVMKAISNLDIITLLPVALGVIAGGIVGIKFVKILLRRHPQALYFAILGLVVGSIFAIYPGFAISTEGIIALIGMLLCAAASYRLGNK